MTLSPKCYLLAIAFIIISIQQSIAQEEILFQVKFKPNKAYITEMVNTIQMDMDFDVDSTKKRQMESTGMKLPMHMDMFQEMTLSNKTGDILADKRIPMTMSYDKVGITMSMNGQEMKQPNQFVGMKIKGYATENGKISIDSIEGNGDVAVKDALKKMVFQLLAGIEFPNKVMKIGDSMTQKVPMEMPMNGNAMSMLVNVTYVLKEIKGNQAFFDYTQVIDMKIKTDKGNSNASGTGSGKMIYDIPANYITDTNGDMAMKMNMQMGEMLMKMDMKAKTSLKAKVM